MDSTYTITNSSTTMDPATSSGILFGAMLFYFLIIVAFYVFTAVCLGKIFKKAGVESWKAWVPFLNIWKMLEIGGQQGFWAILTVVPVVNIASIIFMYVAMYHIGKKLGKGDAFVLLAIFFSIVWYPWLAFDQSTWDESQGAPRRDTPTLTATPALMSVTTPPTPAPTMTPEQPQQPQQPPVDQNQTPPTMPTL